MKLSRRQFAGSLAGWGVLATCGLGRAAGDEAASRRAETADLTRAAQKTGLKITRIETFTQGTQYSAVRITADDGTQGIGQMAPSDADISATILHRKLAPLVLGADPGEVVALSEKCIEANYKFPWSFVCRALAGIDTALWDLLARRHDKPVCELLGARPKRIPVYGSSMRRDIQPPDEAARLARLRQEQGYGAFKVRVGKRTGHDQDEWPGRTEALVPAVRKAVGDDCRLLTDANSCYSVRRAIEVGRLLEQYGFSHYEEPCPFWELESTAEVAAALSIPVAGGEQDNDLAQWRRMVRLKAVDLIQPDICYVGGFTRAWQVAQIGAAAKLACVPHSANHSLVSVFTLHLLAAIANPGPHMEFSIEPNESARAIYEPALQVEAGQVAVPDGPGWGVRLRQPWLDAATRHVSA